MAALSLPDNFGTGSDNDLFRLLHFCQIFVRQLVGKLSAHTSDGDDDENEGESDSEVTETDKDLSESEDSDSDDY